MHMMPLKKPSLGSTKKIHLFDTSQPFKPWLYRMAINICNDHYKRKNLGKSRH